MPETPEVRKGPVTQPGGAEQLPQGAATELNAQPPMMQPEQMPLPPTPGGPVQFADDGYDPSGNVSPAREDDQILFGDPPMARPVRMTNPQQQRVPVSVVRHLPMMRAMLENPNAPASLRAVYRAIVDRLETELKRG